MQSLETVLQPGRNCWRRVSAERFALIVDAADYFRAAKDAILQASHSVMLIGWDFDTRIQFEPEGQTLDGPNELGAFLRWIDRTRPGLKVHLLKWDLGILRSFGRGATPLFILDWMTSRHIQVKLDAAHPAGAAHHQKIVVVDDCLAFCGGIDMTADRWDTRGHRDDDPRRRRPSGRAYGPWHDATSCVDGEAARSLGELARERWFLATGERLAPPPPRPAIWPRSLEATFRNIEAAIARSLPPLQDQPEVREIEMLYLDCIAQAKKTIYCESQYFASRKIAETMAERLKEPDGPEIVLVNPLSADGWLQAATMDTARANLFSIIKAADRHGRFRIYTPKSEKGADIYVHAKILIIDNRLLRIGSSNLNNRSLGFDTECDLAIEARADEKDLRRQILAVRDDLLAEHLGVEPATVTAAVAEAGGRLLPAIERLRGAGRSLAPYHPDETGLFGEILSESVVADPERPPKFWRFLRRPLH